MIEKKKKKKKKKKNIANKIDAAKTHFSAFLQNPSPNTFFLKQVEEYEVLQQIQNLKLKKSPGHDGIKPSIIKAAYEILVRPLTHLYNVSLSSGIVPNIWKIAKVIPIFKKGETFLPENYRPISLLSCFEKILEKLMAKRILSFIREQKILYELQFGFRENHSTLHALLELTDQIYSNLDKNKFCVGVFLDLSKAFDTIDHSILLSKLDHYGFRGVVNKWFSSYLKNRQQFTIANGQKSDYGQINKGVPQGSVLGPILFTLYVNDMAMALNFKPRLFADDTNIFSFDADINNLTTSIDEELKKLYEWFNANKLKVNLDKTNYCIFSPNRNMKNDHDIKITMGSDIKEATDIKYLGLKIDSKLTWSKHVEKIKSEIVKFASLFAKLRHFIPKDCLIILFDSLVSSKINYGLEIYGSAANKYLKELQILQNRILKIINFKDHMFSTNLLHKELKILKTADLHEINILKLMHHVQYNRDKLPDVFQNYFTTNEGLHKYTTRQTMDYRIYKSSKTWGDKTFRNKGARLWNNLPKSIKNITKIKKFTASLKEFKIAKYK